MLTELPRRHGLNVGRHVVGTFQGVNVGEDFRRNGIQRTLQIGGNKLRSKLGWQPRYADLRTIVEHAWNSHGSGDGAAFANSDRFRDVLAVRGEPL